MPAPSNQPPEQKKISQLATEYENSGLSPSMFSGWTEQAANIYGGYKDSLALLKMQRANLRGQFRGTAGDIRAQKKIDLRAAAGAAADRGTLGSSTDVETRNSISAGARSDIVQARDALTQGVINSRSEGMQARRDFFASMAALSQNRTSARTDAATAAMLANSNGGGNGGGGQVPPGGVDGVPNKWLKVLSGAKGAKGVARRIEQLAGGLFDVSELEGFQGQGPLSSGHTAGSEHYGPGGGIDGTGFDVNTTRNNNTSFEKAKLRKLFLALNALYNLEESTPNEANVGSPGWHGHGAFDSRRWGRRPHRNYGDSNQRR